MKLFYSFPIWFLSYTIFINSTKAQAVSLASGGNATGSGGTISFSVGQVADIKATGTNGSVGAGIQQPYEIFIITGIKNNQLNITNKLFPNPTTDFITLDIKDADIKDLFYTLTDINGKTLIQQNIANSSTNISMVDFSTGVYFLNISNKDNQIQSYKILKNK